MAWYLKWPADSGNSTTNRALVQISGISGTLSTVRYTLHENLPPRPSGRARYLFDIRRQVDSTTQGSGTGWLLTTADGGVDSSGTSGHLINGIPTTAAGLFGTIAAESICSFNVNSVPSGGCIAFGARFNEIESFTNIAIRNIVIIDGAGTHTIDMSSSGGTSNEFTSTDGAVTLKLFNFTGGQWVFYNSVTANIPNNTLGAALNQPCAINLNNIFPGATSFSVLSGSLPAGLSISGNQIVGTPTTAQSTQFVIRATNSIDELNSAEITFNTGLWYLKFDGVDDRINIPVVTLGVNDYVEVVITNYTGKSGLYHFLMDDDSDTSRLFFGIRTTNRIEIPAGTTALVNGAVVANDGLFTSVMNGADHTIRLTNNAGTKRVGRIGSRLNGIETWPGGIKSVAFSIGGSITRYYDPNTSGGVGNLLIDRVSGQNGTQSGTWPADNAEWISYAPAGGATELAASVFNVSTLSTSLSVGSTLQSLVGVVSTLTASLLKGTTISASIGGVSSLSCVLSDSDPGMSSFITANAFMQASLLTGAVLQSSLQSRSAITVSITVSQDQDHGGITQNKKLILINNSKESYPTNTINDAMDSYLEQRYTINGGLSDLIARYLGE